MFIKLQPGKLHHKIFRLFKYDFINIFSASKLLCLMMMRMPQTALTIRNHKKKKNSKIWLSDCNMSCLAPSQIPQSKANDVQYKCFQNLNNNFAKVTVSHDILFMRSNNVSNSMNLINLQKYLKKIPNNNNKQQPINSSTSNILPASLIAPKPLSPPPTTNNMQQLSFQ